jgi:hypothetical protein
MRLAMVRVDMAMMPDPRSMSTSPFNTDVMLALARRLVAVSEGVEGRVAAVKLSTISLRQAAIRLRDQLHADTVTRLQGGLQEIIMIDPLLPMVVDSQAAFEDAVTTFQLHMAPHLLTVEPRFRGITPAAGGPPIHRLPFTPSVPAVGHTLLGFVTHAFDVADACTTDSSSDERVLQYLQVAGRVVASLFEARLRQSTAELAEGSASAGLLHAALMGANATAMCIVFSVVEQRLIIRWRGPIPSGAEELGVPRLLSGVTEQLNDVASHAFGYASSACQQRLNAIFEPGKVMKYWIKRAPRNKGKGPVDGAASPGLNPLQPPGGSLAFPNGASPTTIGSNGHFNESQTTNTTADTLQYDAALASKPSVVMEAVCYIRETKEQLETFWSPQLVKALCSAALMHLVELVQNTIQYAIKYSEDREAPKLKFAVDQFETDTVDIVTSLAAELGRKMPANLKQFCAEMRLEAEAREVDYAMQRAEMLSIQAAAQDAMYFAERGAKVMTDGVVKGVTTVGTGVVKGTVMVKDGVVTVATTTTEGVKAGVHAVGSGVSAVGSGLNTAGQAVAKATTDSAKTVKRGVLDVFRTKKTIEMAGGENDSMSVVTLTPRGAQTASGGPSQCVSATSTPRAALDPPQPAFPTPSATKGKGK